MDQNLKSLAGALVLVLVSSSFFISNARVLDNVKHRTPISEGFYIESVKAGWPIVEEKRDEFINSVDIIFGEIKQSGPSIGEGN